MKVRGLYGPSKYRRTEMTTPRETDLIGVGRYRRVVTETKDWLRWSHCREIIKRRTGDRQESLDCEGVSVRTEERPHLQKPRLPNLQSDSLVQYGQWTTGTHQREYHNVPLPFICMVYQFC